MDSEPQVKSGVRAEKKGGRVIFCSMGKGGLFLAQRPAILTGCEPEAEVDVREKRRVRATELKRKGYSLLRDIRSTR